MGLFSAIFGSKKSSKVNIPSWVEPGLKSFSGDISSYLKTNPQQYVAPASPLQTTAFNNATNLGASTQPLNNALSAIQSAGALPAANAGSASQTGPASIANLAQSGPAALSTASTYNAPQLGAAAQAGATNISPIERIQGQSLLQNLQSYMDPSTEALVNSTMANYNRSAAQQRAQMQAQMAGNGAWGSGGRFYESNFDLGNLLQGSQLENQLRSNAFTQAINASNLDAGRRQDAAGFNAGAFNTRALNQAGLNQALNLFNTGAQNEFSLNQANLDQSAGQFNANAQNQNSMFNAGQQNNLSMFNTGQENAQNQFNAGQQNGMAQFNTGQQNQMASLNAQLQQAANQQALQAAGMQGDLANQIGNNQRADVALQGTLGDMQHGISQAQAGAYPSQLLTAAQMFNPLLSTFGQTNTSTPSPFNAALSVMSLFGSDKRLKTNIVRIGDWDDKGDGLGKYEWNWKADPNGEKVTGVIAQEVERLRPQAFVKGFVGGIYDGVNYAALEAA